MSTSLWLDRSPTKEHQEFDVVIIGAGIAGVSTAYWLRKNDPDLKIALVEKNRLAFGATGRNAGFITCGSVEHFNRLVGTHGLEKAHEIWNFSEKNLELLKEEVIKDHDAIEFEQKGSFSLAASDSELQELRKSAEFMSQCGIPVEELSGGDIQERLSAVNFVGGIKYVSDASVHPVKLARAILDATPGVQLFEHNEVHRIDRDGASRQVHSDQHVFTCDLVIFTTNGYSANLDPYFKDKIYPTRGQILTLEKMPKFMEGPCYANFVLDYFRQLPSGELLIGGFRQIEKATEVGYSDHVSEAIQNALFEFIQTYLPQFKGKQVTHRWAGVMGFSADGQPLVGALPQDPQTFFCAGFTAHGLGLAFHSGKCLADLIFDRSIPDFISAKRF